MIIAVQVFPHDEKVSASVQLAMSALRRRMSSQGKKLTIDDSRIDRAVWSALGAEGRRVSTDTEASSAKFKIPSGLTVRVGVLG